MAVSAFAVAATVAGTAAQGIATSKQAEAEQEAQKIQRQQAAVENRRQRRQAIAQQRIQEAEIRAQQQGQLGEARSTAPQGAISGIRSDVASSIGGANQQFVSSVQASEAISRGRAKASRIGALGDVFQTAGSIGFKAAELSAQGAFDTTGNNPSSSLVQPIDTSNFPQKRRQVIQSPFQGGVLA